MRYEVEAGKADTLPEIGPSPDGHAEVRLLLGAVGPIVLGVGILFIATGMVSFFSSMGTFEPPRYFWCMFVGMPITALGAALTRFGYIGPASRYLSRELRPVATETFNEAVGETQGGLETLAHAVGRGLSAGIDSLRGSTDTPEDEGRTCASCKASNPADARFCHHCGAPFEALACPSCGQALSPQARFCDQCGRKIEA